MRTLLLRTLAAVAMAASLFATATAQIGYHITDSVVVGGMGGWDYVAFDARANTIYVAHNDEVVAIDAKSKSVLAHIPAHGSHGIAVAHEFNRGFITNGKTNSVSIFELSSFKVLNEVKVGAKPDAIVYDSSTKRVFVMDGDSNTCTVLDASSGSEVGSIPLGGSPEFGLADGEGHVYLNLEDKNELIVLDARTMKVARRWDLIGGEGPTGLAYDRADKILFSGCHNGKMILVNAMTGATIKSLPIGSRVDATGFDPGTRTAFSSNGDGTLTVIHGEENNREFEVVDVVQTEVGARTMALDPATHTLYLAAAVFGPAPERTETNSHPRPTIVPGSFKILILKSGE